MTSRRGRTEKDGRPPGTQEATEVTRLDVLALEEGAVLTAPAGHIPPLTVDGVETRSVLDGSSRLDDLYRRRACPDGTVPIDGAARSVSMAPMASIDEVNNRLTLTTDGVATTLTRGATYSRALTRTVVRGPGRSGYPL